MDWAQLALTLGLGGALGAAAGLWSSVKRAELALASFRSAVSQFLSDGTSPEAVRIRGALTQLETELRGVGTAFERLKRAMRWK